MMRALGVTIPTEDVDRSLWRLLILRARDIAIIGACSSGARRRRVTLFDKLTGVDETDLLHMVTLRRGQNLGDVVVLHMAVRGQMQLGLRILGGGILKLLFKVRQRGNLLPIPGDRAIVVDVEIDDDR